MNGKTCKGMHRKDVYGLSAERTTGERGEKHRASAERKRRQKLGVSA